MKIRKTGRRPSSLNMPKGEFISPVESEANNPDNYPSLSLYLERTGKINLVPKAKLLKARGLYVNKNWTEDRIAEELDVSLGVVQQWVTCFDWDEKRQILLFRQFQRLEDIKKEKGKYVDQRHDRIASTLEASVEDMLNRHRDPDDPEFELSPKDLTALATTLKSMQVVRRTVHDKPQAKSESRTELVIDSGPGIDNLVKMVENLTGSAPALEPPKTKQIQVEIHDDDRAFEDSLVE